AGAPAALANSTASMSLDQGAGTSAGGTHNLGLTLSFSDTNADSPKDLTINLPPGLLANAAIDNGRCLTTAASSSPAAACQVGSGTVTAQPDLPVLGSLPAPVSVPVSFFLVKPPSSGDLAGLEVYSSSLGEQLGGTGDVLIRPSGDPQGVGATIKLVLPDTLTLTLPLLGKVNAAPISITRIASTFNGLRYPTTCPASAARLTATVDSYQNASTQTLSQPLAVTGCGSLAYNPSFSVSARKDSGDKGVALTTNVTETAAMAPSQSVSLAFPTSVLGPNLASLADLCRTLSSGCPQVGSVTAQSSLYPTALTGRVFFTGNASGPTLTLVFPAPFPLTLTGTINLVNNSATFTGLPDIPLTSLAVTLNGGSRALFDTDCATPSGTATAKLVDQNADQTRNVAAKFSVAGCPGVSPGAGSGSGAGAGAGATTNGSSATSAGPTATASGTRLAAHGVTGLAKGRPSISFRLAVARHRPAIARITVSLPAGLHFRGHRGRHRLLVRGVRVRGAAVRSAVLSHGHLVLRFRRSTRRAEVTLGPSSLRETRALRARARAGKLRRLRLRVSALNTRRQTRSLTVTILKSHLS
ncbi:MAG TPA: hypothetical protein VFN65_02295, partial [Solirubrobacteraceae bacterium]|nr:hypothetical protein [Solirubrobacteraceae bacterium]